MQIGCIGLALGVLIYFFVQLLNGRIDSNAFYIVTGIIVAVVVLILYISNYKESSYGGKFKDRY
ncbi:MAG: hypothetical protein Q4C49_08740 [Bacillota bacterium]|nr:hypothetical protein [Bacillota bacterium]